MPIIKQNDIIDVIYETICGYEPEKAYEILELYRAKRLIPIDWIVIWLNKNNKHYCDTDKMLEDWEAERGADK